MRGVKLLLKLGANLNVRNKSGDTPLHIAVEEGRIEIVEILLEAGADIQVEDHENNTPLHLAAIRGSLGIIASLVDAGASLHKKGNYQFHEGLHKVTDHGDVINRITQLQSDMINHVTQLQCYKIVQAT